MPLLTNLGVKELHNALEAQTCMVSADITPKHCIRASICLSVLRRQALNSVQNHADVTIHGPAIPELFDFGALALVDRCFPIIAISDLCSLLLV